MECSHSEDESQISSITKLGNDCGWQLGTGAQHHSAAHSKVWVRGNQLRWYVQKAYAQWQVESRVP